MADRCGQVQGGPARIVLGQTRVPAQQLDEVDRRHPRMAQDNPSSRLATSAAM